MKSKKMSSPEYIVTEKWSTRRYAVTVVGIITLALILLLAGYFAGNRHSISLIDENDRLTSELQSSESAISDLEKQLIMQRQINKVEQAANAEAGQSLDDQIQTIRSLQRELTFYRNILAPEESQRGLQISQFIRQAVSEDKVSWQVSLLQAGSTGNMMQGLATIDLIYLSSDGEQRLQITNTSGNREFGFKFRYFQHLSGEIQLTQDMQPIALEVTARQYGANSSPVTKRFEWGQSLEGAIANVGQ